MGRKKGKDILIRRIIQIAFLVLIAGIAVNHTLVEEGGGLDFLSSASLHAVCPFGGVVSIYQYFTTGTYVQKIHESSFILMFIVFGLAVVFGPVFCGWICPFGTVQELIGKIGRKIFGSRYNAFLPYAVDKWLRFLRYIVLGLVVYMTAVTGKLMFADVDPYYALFNFWTGEVALTGLIVLGVTLLLSLFVERPFCKYACPYGALLGLFNFIRIFKIKRNESTCINCGLCDQKCPMNIPVSQKTTVRNHQCISCLECTSEAVCPRIETIEFKISGPRKEAVK